MPLTKTNFSCTLFRMTNNISKQISTPTQVFIDIVRIIADEMESIRPVFNKNCHEFHILHDILHKDAQIENFPQVMGSPLILRFIQLFLLTGINAHSGLEGLDIHAISNHDNYISIVWKTGIRDEFLLGEMAEDFTNFLKSYRAVILPDLKSHQLSTAMIKQVFNTQNQYHSALNIKKENLELLFKHQHSLNTVLDQPQNKDLIFLLISCLPYDQLNIFLMNISKYIPEEVSIKTASGNQVKADAFFEMAASDLQFLIEKVLVYHFLYSINQWPEFNQLTHSKIKSFLLEQLQNKAVHTKTFESIQSTQTHILGAQLSLLSIFRQLFNKLLSA